LKRLRAIALLVAVVAVLAISGEAIINRQLPATHSIYRSTDNGASWIGVGDGLPSGARVNAFASISGRIVAGTDRGVFLSDDEGDSWRASADAIAGEARILCLATLGNQTFAGSHRRGVLVSGDAGQTWKTANVGLTDLHIRSLLSVDRHVYAGSDNQGVFVSRDSGATWARQSDGLPPLSQVFDLARLNNAVYAALYHHGVYQWRPDDKLWRRVGDVVPLELTVSGGTLIAGHNPGAVHYSDDNCETWFAASGLTSDAPVWTLASDNRRAFVGATVKTNDEIVCCFLSEDQGHTWRRRDAGLPRNAAPICFLVENDFILTCVCIGVE